MKRLAGLGLTAVFLASASVAWDAYGHRTIAYLALKGLPREAPAWLRSQETADRVAFQSNECDRWKGWPRDTLHHINKPDHYLDVELLENFGLTLETIPRLRREYVRAMAISKHVHPEMAGPYDAKRDPARTQEWPGFALHAIDENYAKLQATFNEIRILEHLNDPRRATQLRQARENAIFHMGLLAHFVADVAQPLHTTKHHNGWVGDNPNGYVTERGIHHAIDSAPASLGLTVESLAPLVKYDAEPDAADPWDDVMEYLRRSHALVETVYRLERDGELDKEPGRKLIEQRVCDAASMLSALFWGAWTSSEPTEKQIADWVRYNNFDAEAKLRARSAHE